MRRAAQVGAALAARSAPEWSERLLAMLADRPLAVESPAPGLTALTNRMIGYLDADAGYGRGIRSIVRLSTWPPTVKPICASSPAARIVVVTSSVPVGAPIGFGGGSQRMRGAQRRGGGAHGRGPAWPRVSRPWLGGLRRRGCAGGGAAPLPARRRR